MPLYATQEPKPEPKPEASLLDYVCHMMTPVMTNDLEAMLKHVAEAEGK